MKIVSLKTVGIQHSDHCFLFSVRFNINILHYRVDNCDIAEYYPVILTGDFNLEPNTPVHKFLINGTLNYRNLQKPTLWPQNNQSNRGDMGNELLPKSLGITESSQHANILELRKTNNYKRQTNDSLYSKVI